MRGADCQARGAPTLSETRRRWKGMPKDKNLGKHKSRYEVRGGLINEFDFHRNQGALAEGERDRFARQEEERRLREGEAEATSGGPQTEAERIQEVIEAAHEKVEQRRENEQGAAAQTSSAKKARAAGKGATGGTKKAGAKKSPAKAGASKKGAGKKGASKTSATVRGGAKRSAAAKGAGKKGGVKKGQAGGKARKGGRTR
jgi:hypothetical protein